MQCEIMLKCNARVIAGVVDKNIYSQLFSNAVVSDFKKIENVQ